MNWNDKTDPTGVIDETVYTLQATENVPFGLIDWAQHQYADRVTNPTNFAIEQQRAELAGRIARGVMDLLARPGGLRFFKVVHGDPDGLELISRVQLRAVDPLGEMAKSTTMAEPLTTYREGPHLLLTLRHVDFARSGLREYADRGGIISIVDEQTHDTITMEVTRQANGLTGERVW